MENPTAEEEQNYRGNLDGASSEDEDDPPADDLNPITKRRVYTTIPFDGANANPTHKITNQVFISGLDENSWVPEFYADWSVSQIVLFLATKLFEQLIACTNRYHPTTSISMRDMFLYRISKSINGSCNQTMGSRYSDTKQPRRYQTL